MSDASFTTTPIPLSRLKSSGFCEEDKAGLRHYIDPNIHYQWLYNDPQKRWVFMDREIVEMDDIKEISNSNFDGPQNFSSAILQTHRVRANPKRASILGDIRTNGWALDVLPPALFKVKDKNGEIQSYRGDGSTRIDIGRGEGFPNMLFDTFYIENMADFVKLGLMLNQYQKPFGEGSLGDIVKGMKSLLDNDLINFSSSEKGYKNFSLKTLSVRNDVDKLAWAAEVIKKEIGLVSCNKIRPQDLNNAATDLLNDTTGETIILSFPKGRGLPEYMKSTLGLTNQSDIKYVPFSGGEKAYGKFSESIYTHRTYLEENPLHRLYYTLYVGAPNPDNPIAHWEESTIKFAEEAKRYMDWLGFKSAHGNQVVIKGAIPQVKGASDKYPLHKLWEFPTDLGYMW
tara:strand:- start:486 stop:1682 length:1197 start_codon:yes stop_codon:yes gene_type:complete